MATAAGRREFIVQAVMDSITRNMDIPEDVQQTALTIYRQASQEGLVRGRSIEVVVSASLYAAIRMHKAPHTLEDITRNTEPKKKNIGRMYRILVKNLDLKTLPINMEDTVVKMCQELKLGEKTQADAVELMTRVEDAGLLSGRNPMSIVAAVIYHSSLKFDEKLTQRTLSFASGVTEATIRNRNREIEEALELPKLPRHPADLRAARKRREAELKAKAELDG